MTAIREATKDEIPTVRDLLLEYARTLDFDLSFQNFDDELKLLPGDYAPPSGSLLLAIDKDEVAGCVALRPLEDTICEMKRLYVKPRFRGSGTGRRLVSAIIKMATDLGYKKMRLDTAPSMKTAIQVYRDFGFYPIEPYRPNPVPGAAFFEKDFNSNETESG